MARHQEPLDKGLVTIRDPGLLKEGELTFVRNAVYLPGSNALQRARGRAAFGTATATAVDVVGLRDLAFDNGDHYLVAHATASYVTAVVGDTGTFGVLVSGIGTGTQLEVAQFRNRYYLMNGTSANASAIGTNQVVYLSATAAGTAPSVRQHGMLPVQAAPNITTAGGGAFALTVTGYYEYWTTEVARITQDGAFVVLESSFDRISGPTTVLVSATGVVPTIQLPAVRNTPTTHWRIYRSPKKTRATDVMFPSGFMISELSTGASGHADTTAAASASGLPTVFNSSGIHFGFASASSMATDNGVYASATIGAAGALVGQGAYTFSVPAITGAVHGIAVEVQGYVSAGSAPVPISVGLGIRASTGDWADLWVPFGPEGTDVPLAAWKSGQITSTNSGSPTTLILGGPRDTWFPAAYNFRLRDIDISANLMVVVYATTASRSIGIDYIKVTAYYGASTESTVPFSSVVYTFGDITAQVGKNMPPPSSSTGAVFQDSLVTNDVANPSQIRWSSPGEPESFPPTYYLDFETRENDQVRFIGVVNNRLIVGLDSSLWRVNYLPSERDATFDRGNAVEAITRNYGIVNPMGACTFSTDGTQERLAFVSNQGVHATDGFNLETYTGGLDWRGDRDGLGIAPVASASNYVPQALVNDRERQELLFYFRNDALGSSDRYWCLHFQYNELIDGKPRVSGMVAMENTIAAVRAAPKSMWTVPRSSGTTDVFIGYGTAVSATASAAGAGQVYRETGTSLPSQEARMRYRTRRMFLAGIGNEWKFGELYGYCGLVSWASTPGTITYQSGNRKTNYPFSLESIKDYTFTTAGVGELVHRVTFNQMCEGLVISATVSGAGTFSQEYLILDGEGFGVEDSGL